MQCIQTLTEHTSVVMSVLCWDQFLLSCSLDQQLKVCLTSMIYKDFCGCVCVTVYCARTVNLFSSNCLVCAGLGCYSKWKLGSNIYSQGRTCMLFMFQYMSSLFGYIAIPALIKNKIGIFKFPRRNIEG